jgi:alkylation response protein AidB-like acyl-CoA dehydrogenase
MSATIPSGLRRLEAVAADITREVIAPRGEEVDRDGTWPEHSLRALGEARLMGLHVPRRLGGQEQGLLALALLSDTIARGCPASALCFAMHCTGSAVIAAKATPYHEDRYLVPIARGEHVTTLALSEAGTGVHFYLPETDLRRTDEGFELRGTKQFVTNGGRADSYVVSTRASNVDLGEFSCLVVDADMPGLEWLEPWRGFGMRGNSSRGLRIDGARVPLESLLGKEGDQIWYAFEVVAPYFLIAMAGTYLGIAQAALDETVRHVQQRQHAHSGEHLADVPDVQRRVADMTIAVSRTRSLVYDAAYLGDLGDARATVEIMKAKADAAAAAVNVTNEAMTCCGGSAYRDNGRLTRLLRDARAGHVMAPTTDLLKTWIARLTLGRPLL